MAYFEDIKTLSDISSYHQHALGDKTAMIFEGRETSYNDLAKHGWQIANGLQAANLKPQDRVAYLGKNSDSFFELFQKDPQ